jgi:glucokinase
MVNIKQYVIGLDVGGTKIRGGLWNGEKIIADYELATPQDNLDHFLVMAKAVVDPLLEKADSDKVKVAGIGIGIPGEIEEKTGKLYGAPNLPILNGKPVIGLLNNLFNLPVRVDNDAKTFIRGEVLAGAAKQRVSAYGITLGTGIGAAWWANNDVYKGSFGGANEAGHSVINISAAMDFETSFHQLTQNNPGKLSQEAILGDQLAQKAFAEFGRNLGALMANIVNLIEPEVFVLGGSVMDSADLFLAEAKKTMKQYILLPFAASKVKVLKSKLGPNAGVIGAALLITRNA